MTYPIHDEKDSILIKDGGVQSYATTSNDLVNARYSLGLTETRLFLLALSQISPNDEKLKTYRIYINDFLESVGADTRFYDNINIMKPITKKLISKVIEIVKKDGRPKQFNLVSMADYSKDAKGAFVELTFNQVIKPDLIQLKEKFLSYDLRYILPCKSVYSVRLYQLLKQFLYKGERIETVANLKYMFEIENQYKQYNDFKKKVILQAQTELKEKTDIYFDFEEIKTGRTITDIKFLIHKQKPQLATGAIQPAEVRPVDQSADPIINRLTSLGFNEKQAQEITKRETPEFITANADILEELQRQGRINTSIPAFSKGFTKDFRQTKSAHETEQEAKQEQARQEAERIAKAKAEQEKAEQLGQKIYNESLKTYVNKFFNDREQNAELIKEFETKYIKTGVGATLFKNRPETAKTAFIQTNKQIDINTEVIKIAESNGYILTFNGEQWQAIEDNQEKLF